MVGKDKALWLPAGHSYIQIREVSVGVVCTGYIPPGAGEGGGGGGGGEVLWGIPSLRTQWDRRWVVQVCGGILRYALDWPLQGVNSSGISLRLPWSYWMCLSVSQSCRGWITCSGWMSGWNVPSMLCSYLSLRS